YVLVGIGISLSQNWVTVLNQAGKGQIIDTYLAVAVASYVYYKLCTKLPDQAVTWLSGRFAMGFETATDIKSGVKTAAAVPAEVMGGIHRVAGMARAFGAADQAAKATLALQDKKETQWNVAGETIKTLGAAWKQEKWNKTVEGTLGGKMAKDIAAGLDTEATTKSDDDSGDFSI
ncbi:MAG: hypothetical protein KGJ11_05930, partial [Candidatus Omnitrophica bacterium]|nr:hypothetical protein [Candidatus Omnitrophota bacterium]